MKTPRTTQDQDALDQAYDKLLDIDKLVDDMHKTLERLPAKREPTFVMLYWGQSFDGYPVARVIHARDLDTAYVKAANILLEYGDSHLQLCSVFPCTPPKEFDDEG